MSAAFFLSIEFQQTGYLVYRAHQAAYGAGPLLRIENFFADAQEIAQGVVVMAPGWEDLLETNKRAYFENLVLRPEFIALYAQTMSPEQFVDA